MCSGSRCPGSVRGERVPKKVAMSRGEASIHHEEPNDSSCLGLWEVPRELKRFELEKTRTKLACRALALLGIFVVASLCSITWVTLAGKQATAVGNCIEIIATPLFGLVMLVVGYYYGHSNRKVTAGR
jgi:hypothetical protein